MIRTERGARRLGYLSALLGVAAYFFTGVAVGACLYGDVRWPTAVLVAVLGTGTVAFGLRIDLPILGEHCARRWREGTPLYKLHEKVGRLEVLIQEAEDRRLSPSSGSSPSDASRESADPQRHARKDHAAYQDT